MWKIINYELQVSDYKYRHCRANDLRHALIIQRPKEPTTCPCPSRGLGTGIVVSMRPTPVQSAFGCEHSQGSVLHTFCALPLKDFSASRTLHFDARKCETLSCGQSLHRLSRSLLPGDDRRSRCNRTRHTLPLPTWPSSLDAVLQHARTTTPYCADDWDDGAVVQCLYLHQHQAGY